MKKNRVTLILAVMVVFGGISLAQDRKYEGVEIVIGDLSRTVSEAMDPFIAEYEQLTGATVRVERHALDSLHDKMMLEFAARSGYFDIVYLSPSYMGTLIENDYIVPVNDLMASHDFSLEDFTAAAVDIYRYGEGEELWGVPYLADTTILLYRTDLFEDPQEKSAFLDRYGYPLAPPRTTDELLDMAEFFTRDTDGDGRTDIFGFGYPQAGVAYGYLSTLPWIWTFGGRVYDEQFQAELNSPEAIRAFEWLAELQQYQPPGVLGWEYAEHVTMMSEGHLAMAAGWFQFGIDMNNPESSSIAGRVGYAPIPSSPDSDAAVGRTVLGGGALAVTSDSRNREAAFDFLAWMFGDADRSLDYFLAGGAATRKSVYDSPRIVELFPWAEEFFPVAVYALNNQAQQRPTLPEAFSIFEVIAAAWHNVALQRTEPAEALEDANSEVNRILRARHN